MFTQLNQYHVVLEVEPEFQKSPAEPARSVYPDRRRGFGDHPWAWWRAERPAPFRPDRPARYRPRRRAWQASGAAGVGAASQLPSNPPRHFPTEARFRSPPLRMSRMTSVPITVNHQGQFPVVTLSFNLAPNASLGEAVKAVNKVKDEIGMPPSIQAAVSRAPPKRSRLRWRTSRC